MSYCSLLTYTNKDLKPKVKVRVAVSLPQTLDRELLGPVSTKHFFVADKCCVRVLL